jgi:hypothetical protein
LLPFRYRVLRFDAIPKLHGFARSCLIQERLAALPPQQGAGIVGDKM